MGNKLSGPKKLLRWSPRKVSCKSWKGHRSEYILKYNSYSSQFGKLMGKI